MCEGVSERKKTKELKNEESELVCATLGQRHLR